MKIRMFQVDAFTDTLFGGNPAAVCLLPETISDDLMQKIAAENNLAETAFLVENQKPLRIRWFTPKVEVDLCGHATLATAHVLFNELSFPENILRFESRSGVLEVRNEGGFLVLNFPSDPPGKGCLSRSVLDSLGMDPIEILKGKSDYLLVYENQQQVEELDPEFQGLGKATARGVIVTAPGKNCDFVSRFFGPQVGINEDPVTGSAHTTLTPYWSARLGKKELAAMQLSERKGNLRCRDLGDRIEIAGKAVTYFEGWIDV